MGKKQKKVTEQKQYVSKKNEAANNGNGLNVQSLLNDAVVNKLKAVAQTMKQEQETAIQQKAEADEELRKAEQKRLENDFAYLLEHSDPKSHKYK